MGIFSRVLGSDRLAAGTAAWTQSFVDNIPKLDQKVLEEHFDNLTKSGGGLDNRINHEYRQNKNDMVIGAAGFVGGGMALLGGALATTALSVIALPILGVGMAAYGGHKLIQASKDIGMVRKVEALQVAAVGGHSDRKTMESVVKQAWQLPTN